MKIASYKRYILLPIVLVVSGLLLSGCNLEGNDENAQNDNVVSYITVNANDNYEVFSIEKDGPIKVDLSDKITVSSEERVKIRTVEPINNNTCKIDTVRDLSFNIEATEADACDFIYDIELVDGNKNKRLIGKSSAISRVVISKNVEDAVLMPFGSTAYKNQELEIDVKAQLQLNGEHTDLSTLELLPDVVILPDDSDSTVLVDTTTSKIFYTPSLDFIGTERILYSLKNPVTEDVFIGTIIVTVSESATIGIEIDSMIKKNATVGTINKLDITENVISSEGFDFQLVYVSAFNATVSLVDATDLSNKQFYLEANEPGLYYVNAVVTDHHGSFDVALIEVSVSDPNATAKWGDIGDAPYIYTGPLTKSEADSAGVVYDGAYYDTAYDPDINVSTFKGYHAMTYCDAKGELPTTKQLLQLAGNFDVDGFYNWPVQRGYVSSDGEIVDLATGIIKPVDGQPSYVTCIAKGEFGLEIKKSPALANNLDKASVVASLSFGKLAEPVANATIVVTVNGSEPDGNPDVLGGSTQITDENGEAFIELVDTKAEMVTVEVEFEGQSRSAVVEFVGDPNTGKISGLTSSSYYIPYGDVGDLEAKVLDEYSNAITGAEVTFESDNLDATLQPDVVLTNDLGTAESHIKWDGSLDLEYDTNILVTASHESKGQGLTYEQIYVNFITGDLSDLVRVDADDLDRSAIMEVAVLDRSGNGIANKDVYIGVEYDESKGKYLMINGTYVSCPGNNNANQCVKLETDNNGVAVTSDIKLSKLAQLPYSQEVSAFYAGQKLDTSITFKKPTYITSDDGDIIVQPSFELLDPDKIAPSYRAYAEDIIDAYKHANNELLFTAAMGDGPLGLKTDVVWRELCRMVDTSSYPELGGDTVWERPWNPIYSDTWIFQLIVNLDDTAKATLPEIIAPYYDPSYNLPSTLGPGELVLSRDNNNYRTKWYIRYFKDDEDSDVEMHLPITCISDKVN